MICLQSMQPNTSVVNLSYLMILYKNNLYCIVKYIMLQNCNVKHTMQHDHTMPNMEVIDPFNHLPLSTLLNVEVLSRRAAL